MSAKFFSESILVVCKGLDGLRVLFLNVYAVFQSETAFGQMNFVTMFMPEGLLPVPAPTSGQKIHVAGWIQFYNSSPKIFQALTTGSPYKVFQR